MIDAINKLCDVEDSVKHSGRGGASVLEGISKHRMKAMRCLKELERKLSALMIEKDRLEQEYWRKGSQLNSKMELQRRKELEKAIERSNQHIQQTKNRIKELGNPW